MDRHHKPLDDVIDEMRAAASQLIEFTFPKVHPIQELDIDFLKRRRLTIDGYDVVIHFSRSDYHDCMVENLEIYGATAPFLPMFLVCKIAAKFLGKYDLKYAEAIKSGRKAYVWTVALDDRGRPMQLDSGRINSMTYEDFTFGYNADGESRTIY